VRNDYGNSQPQQRTGQAPYFAYLKEADRYSEASVDAAAKAIARFEESTGRRGFQSFHIEQAIAFKRRLAEQRSQKGGERLSKATLHSTLAHLKRFFHWLAGQPGYRRRLSYSDSNYFNLSEKAARIATTRRDKPFPTIEQVKHVIATMPKRSEVEYRNRAVVAFTLLTGARDSAVASMKLKHLDFAASVVYQDARDVKTKFSKTVTTVFFPVGDDIRQIVEDWVMYLRQDKLWGDDDPTVSGDSHRHWTGSPVRSPGREARALEHCRADPDNIPRGIHHRGTALLEPTQSP
jgi:integrase